MHIERVDLIPIPVTNQESSLAFYTEKLGFEVRLDMKHLEDSDIRWIELIPPGAASCVVLAPWEPKGKFGTFVLITTDIEADYAELKAKGLDLPPLEHQPWGTSVMLTDPDGNEILLQQNTAMSASA